MIGDVRGMSRRRRAAAKRWAPVLARSFVAARIGQGGAEEINAPLAVAALTRACSRLILSGEPAVMRLSRREGLAFPGNPPPPVGEPSAWLAVGVDVEGRGAYAVRWIWGDVIRYRPEIETYMLRELDALCARPGLAGLPMQ
jgi:hypothetical protein